jgi:hypothetical protein
MECFWNLQGRFFANFLEYGNKTIDFYSESRLRVMVLKINNYLIRLAIMIIIIFGGTFTASYFRTREFLLDQFLGLSVGVLLLIASLIWRFRNRGVYLKRKN